MCWYWKARIYADNGDYWFVQIKTPQRLEEIDARQDFYFELTGCKMLLEGMRTEPFESIPSIAEGYKKLIGARNAQST